MFKPLLQKTQNSKNHDELCYNECRGIVQKGVIMHTMNLVLILYAPAVNALLLIFLIITSKQKMDKENSLSDLQLHDNEQLHSEIDNKEANVQAHNDSNDTIVTVDTTDIEDSPNDL